MKKETPKRPSADSTREAILSAAKTLFLQSGFAATSISQIAKKAAINQSLIYHHFENKENLWLEVKKQITVLFSEKSNLVFETALEMQDPKQLIETMVHYRFDLYDQFPEMRRIVDWQFLEENPYKLRGIKTEILDGLIQHITDLQQQNKIVKTYPADMLLVYIFHVPVGFFKGFKDMTNGLQGDALKQRKKAYTQLCIESLCNTLIDK